MMVKIIIDRGKEHTWVTEHNWIYYDDGDDSEE